MNHDKFEAFFKRLSISILKWRWFVLMFFLMIVVTGSFGLRKLNIAYSNHDMFLASDSLMVKTEKFREVFGNDMYIGVLVKNDELFSNDHLLEIKDLVQTLKDSVPYVDRVNAITNLYFPESNGGNVQLTRVVPDKIPQSKDSLEAIKNSFLDRHIIFNRLLSKDGNTSWITIKLKNFDSAGHKNGDEQPEIKIGKKVNEIISEPRFSALQPKASGIPYINYMEKQYFDKESKRIIILALLAAVIILSLITRSITGVISPFIIATVSLIAVFGIGGWFGLSVAGLVISLPILLTLAVSVAYSIHIFTFYKNHDGKEVSNRDVIIKSLSSIGWPMLFTTLTTFFALLTILFIKVPAIREIGLITALCVLVVFITTFFLLPVFLSFQTRHEHKEIKKLRLNFTSGLEDKYLNLILKNQKVILTTTILLVIAGLIGMTKIKATFDLKGSIGEEVPYINDWLKVADSELGALYTYDMELEFKNGEEGITPENLNKLEELTSKIKENKLTKNVSSILNVIKGFNYIINDFDPASYRIPYTKGEIDIIIFLIRNFGLNEISNWLNSNNKKVRIITEISSYDSKSLRDNKIVIQNTIDSLFSEVQFSMVGTVPLFAKVNEYVVKGQIQSFAAALLIILLLIIIVFGSVKVGLIALIPNIIPVVIVGGMMGYFNIPLDMMTVTVIPIMIGLGVDDTIHLFSHFGNEFRKNKNYYSTIRKSIQKVGPALIYTTLILSANFLIYTISDAKIFVHTGLLATTGLVTALLADLLIAPILFKRLSVFGNEE